LLIPHVFAIFFAKIDGFFQIFTFLGVFGDISGGKRGGERQNLTI
jgi:hypothetical protein